MRLFVSLNDEGNLDTFFLESGSWKKTGSVFLTEDEWDESAVISDLRDQLDLEFPLSIYEGDCGRPDPQALPAPDWKFESEEDLLKFIGKFKAKSAQAQKLEKLAAWLAFQIQVKKAKILPALESGWKWHDRNGRPQRGKTVENLLSAYNARHERIDRNDIASSVVAMMIAYDRHSNSNYDDLLSAGYPKHLARMMRN